MYRRNKGSYVDLTSPTPSSREKESDEENATVIEEKKSSEINLKTPSPITTDIMHIDTSTTTSGVCNYVTRSWSSWIENTSPKHGSKVLEMEYIPSWKTPDEMEGIYRSATITLPNRDFMVVPRVNRRATRKRNSPGSYVEDLDMLETIPTVSTQSNDEPMNVQLAPVSSTEGRLLETTSNQTHKELVQAAAAANQQSHFRHILLGNDTTSQINDGDDDFLYFIPDFIEELHQRLTKVETEYAWLLEESFYLYRYTDHTFLYNHSSPYLKIKLRTTEQIVPPANQDDFQAKRQEIRRKLLQGHRRGPIMSRVLAQLRFQNRRKSTSSSKNKNNNNAVEKRTCTNDPSANPTAKKAGKTSPPGRTRKPITKSAVLKVRNVPSKILTQPKELKRSPCEKQTATENSLICIAPFDKSVLKTKQCLPNSPKLPLAPTKEVSTNWKHLEQHTIPIEPVDFKLPTSTLLTDAEAEAAWLIEESLLINPTDGPLLSFVQANASSSLQEIISVTIGAATSRRWLPRLYRGHDPYVKQEFTLFRALVRGALQQGYRRGETAGLLPNEYIQLPVAVRVRQAFEQSKLTGLSRAEFSKSLTRRVAPGTKNGGNTK